MNSARARSKFIDALGRGLIRARSLGGHRDYRRFVIVGTARTGSTLLLNLLNAQRNVVAFGEVFRGDGKVGWDLAPFTSRQGPRLQNKLEEHPLRFLETEVFGAWPRDISAVGFKLFYYHARLQRQTEVWEYLCRNSDVVVIHIRRLNILEQYLSLRIAHATDAWSSASPAGGAPAPMRLDPEGCRLHFEDVRAQEAACDAFFASSPVLTLTYEDLVADRGAAMHRVATHLGVNLKPVQPRIVRQRTRPVSLAISNYAELTEFFAGSEWEGFFRETDTLLSGQEAA